MLLGYDRERPTLAHYRDFEKKLVAGLNELAAPGMSLLFYGSYVRDDFVPGRSDIDGVWVFPGEGVIDKEVLTLCSRVLAHALEENHIPFQVTPCDALTVSDGRFNSHTLESQRYFEREGEVVVGPDLRGTFRYLPKKSGDLHSLTFNLRKVRQGLLLSQYHLAHDYKQMLRRFGKSLDAVSRAPKQILATLDGEVRGHRFSGLEAVQELFPEVDMGPLHRIRGLYHNLTELDALYRDPDTVLELWNAAATTFEEMVREYIKRFPAETPQQTKPQLARL